RTHAARLLDAHRRAVALSLRDAVRRIPPGQRARDRHRARAGVALVRDGTDVSGVVPLAAPDAAGAPREARAGPRLLRRVVRLAGRTLRPVVGGQHVRGAHADARPRRAPIRTREPRRERSGARDGPTPLRDRDARPAGLGLLTVVDARAGRLR